MSYGASCKVMTAFNKITNQKVAVKTIQKVKAAWQRELGECVWWGGRFEASRERKHVFFYKKRAVNPRLGRDFPSCPLRAV